MFENDMMMYKEVEEEVTEVKTEEKKRALETILAFINTKDIFPLQDDYDRHFTGEEQKQLIKDLGEKGSMKRLGIVHPSAIFNIAALRELRERRGETVYIAKPNVISWDDTNPTLFENPV